MVRRLLELTDLRDARCLDIGTQEALIPVSLLRLGAKSVVAYDRLDLSERIRLVQQAYGVEFEYIPGLQMDELQTALWKDRKSPLDVVVFSGVLYHMIDPLVGLCIARSLVREGGCSSWKPPPLSATNQSSTSMPQVDTTPVQTIICRHWLGGLCLTHAQTQGNRVQAYIET